MSAFISVYQEVVTTGPVTEALSSNLTIPILIYIYANAALGVIFGLAFILIRRFLKASTHARNYMIITGLGFMVFMPAFGSAVLQAGYPPYGLASLSTLPLSLLMIVYGLTYSAVSVAEDVTLRQAIKKKVHDMKFLESIGTAQMEQELKSEVNKLVEENARILREESGVQPSLSEVEMKEYLEEVIAEVKAAKISS